VQRVPSDRSGRSSGSERANGRSVCVLVGRFFELDRVVGLISRRGQGQSQERGVGFRGRISTRAILGKGGLTLSTDGTEPSLGLSLPPLPCRRRRRRRNHGIGNFTHWRPGHSISRTAAASSRRRILPPRDFATGAKLDHSECAFPTDDQVSTGQEDDIPCVGEADDTFVRSVPVQIRLGIRLSRGVFCFRRGGGETVDFLEEEGVVGDDGFTTDDFERPCAFDGS
jgi:hypothetical protein